MVENLKIVEVLKLYDLKSSGTLQFQIYAILEKLRFLTCNNKNF